MKPDPYKKKASRRYHARKGISKKTNEETNSKTVKDIHNKAIGSSNKDDSSSIDSVSNSQDVFAVNSASSSDKEDSPINPKPENENDASSKEPKSNSPSLGDKTLSNNSFFLSEADIEALEREKAEEEEKMKVLQNFSSILKQKIENAEEKSSDPLSFFRTKKGRNSKYKGKKFVATSEQPVEDSRLRSTKKDDKPVEKAFVKRLDEYKISSENKNLPLDMISIDKDVNNKNGNIAFETLQDKDSVATYETQNDNKKQESEELPNSVLKKGDNSLVNKDSLLSQAEDFLDDLLNQDFAHVTSEITYAKQPEKPFNEIRPPQNINTKMPSTTSHSNVQETDLEAMLDDLLI